MIKAVIVDFDGVLADSFRSLYRLNAFAFRRVGFPLSEDDYRRLFNGNIHKQLKMLIRDEDKIQECLEIKKKRFGDYYGKVRLFPFSRTLVRSLAGRFRMAVVSSTEARFVGGMLRKCGLNRYFEAILGSRAESKIEEMRRAMIAINSTPRSTALITDTAGDIRVGKSIGLETIAVSWGFHDKQQLRKLRPSGVFSNYMELLDYLECRRVA